MAKEELLQLRARRELRQRLRTVVQRPLVEPSSQRRGAELAENAGTLRKTLLEIVLDKSESTELDVGDGLVVRLCLRRRRVVEIVAALLQREADGSAQQHAHAVLRLHLQQRRHLLDGTLDFVQRHFRERANESVDAKRLQRVVLLANQVGTLREQLRRVREVAATVARQNLRRALKVVCVPCDRQRLPQESAEAASVCAAMSHSWETRAGELTQSRRETVSSSV